MREKLVSVIAWPLKEAARALVLLMDWVQRKLFGIVEFSHDPDCIARVGTSVSRKHVALPDGTQVKPGERLGEIHLWNERVPEVPPAGPDMAWVLGLRRKIIRSLRELATYVERSPEFAHVRVFHGGTSFMRRGGPGGMLTGGDLAVRLGFHVVRTPPVEGGGTPSRPSSRGIAADFVHRFCDFWENLYYLALVWTFNPRSLRTKGLGGLARVDLYMTRETLMERYGVLASDKVAAATGQEVKEVGLMGRFKEFREVLLITWQKMMRPQMWILTVVYFVIVNGLGFGLLGTMQEMMQSPAGPKRLAANADTIMIACIGIMVFVPAAMSGLVSLGKAAVERETAGWRDAWKGLGTYYWRIVGFYALACLAVVGLAISFGVYSLAAAAKGGIETASLPLRIIGLVPQYFVATWLAIAASDGVGLFASIGGAVRFAWTNPSLLIPAFALERVSTGTVSSISTGLFRGPPDGSAFAPFGSTRFWGGVTAAALSGYLFMFFILLYLGLYQRAKTWAGQPAPSPVSGALPGEPGTPPPAAPMPPAPPPPDSGQGRGE